MKKLDGLSKENLDLQTEVSNLRETHMGNHSVMIVALEERLHDLEREVERTSKLAESRKSLLDKNDLDQQQKKSEVLMVKESYKVKEVKKKRRNRKKRKRKNSNQSEKVAEENNTKIEESQSQSVSNEEAKKKRSKKDPTVGHMKQMEELCEESEDEKESFHGVPKVSAVRDVNCLKYAGMQLGKWVSIATLALLFILCVLGGIQKSFNGNLMQHSNLQSQLGSFKSSVWVLMKSVRGSSGKIFSLFGGFFNFLLYMLNIIIIGHLGYQNIKGRIVEKGRQVVSSQDFEVDDFNGG